jgi:hypothetical protein
VPEPASTMPVCLDSPGRCPDEGGQGFDVGSIAHGRMRRQTRLTNGKRCGQCPGELLGERELRAVRLVSWPSLRYNFVIPCLSRGPPPGSLAVQIGEESTMRRLASALLVLLLVALAVSACGGSGAPSQPGPDAPAPATNTPSPKSGATKPPANTPVPGGPLSGKRVLANGVWTCPSDTAGAKFVGSLQAKDYHRLDCSSVDSIPAQDRVCFVDEQTALKFGHSPAGDCSPP